MEITTKKVNMYASAPTTVGFGIPRVGNLRGVTMSIADIRQALRSHARIEEIMPDGRLVPLDFTNFDKDNSVQSTLTQEKPVVSIVTPIGAQAPAAPVEEKKADTTIEVHEPEADPFKDVIADPKPAATDTKTAADATKTDTTAAAKTATDVKADAPAADSTKK